jgi:hypothetical protein
MTWRPQRRPICYTLTENRYYRRICEIVAAQSQRHGYAPDFCAYLQRKLREVKAT